MADVFLKAKFFGRFFMLSSQPVSRFFLNLLSLLSAPIAADRAKRALIRFSLISLCFWEVDWPSAYATTVCLPFHCDAFDWFFLMLIKKVYERLCLKTFSFFGRQVHLHFSSPRNCYKRSAYAELLFKKTIASGGGAECYRLIIHLISAILLLFLVY